ncbi:acyl-CoA dehydrogenase family protein [Paenibacillus sp. NEAU-GSW1]|uniref:acyl-CoA dehydrogenase family protein n=1 Tax=Paenibacillus sp. NEAU-GSW1 TaxID=2682486 RepID=UPI0012E113E6|nr:acyl-CoA dehydrogenase family protein [Paenibacillus sp. NEAU-GSW1]MUT68718.1 acyl-CoA dehydrogenase [Paenibacillus sp. NEAU-GSW1]
MRYRFNEETEMTREVIRDFAARELAPLARARDEQGKIEPAVFRQMAQLGLAGIPVEESRGGAGGDIATFAVVLEELSAVCASSAAMLAAHTGFVLWPLQKAIAASGSEHPLHRLLKELASGKKLGGFATGACSQVHELQAQPLGDGGYRLNGRLPIAVNGEDADVILLFASDTGKKPTSRRRLAAYLVEKGTPGLEVEPLPRKLGLRGLSTVSLQFKDCLIPHEQRLVPHGRAIMESVINIGCMGAAAQSVGIAQGALQAAVAYAKERRQFGKPISKQQGVSFKLADMATRVDAARLLLYKAAWRMDLGADARKAAAIARKMSASLAVSVALDAVQLFGGYGYMREYGVERLARDAKCVESDFGTGGMAVPIESRILSGMD